MARPEHRKYYASTIWKNLRRARLHLDGGMCVKCRSRGRVTPATEIDHIRPVSERPDLVYQIENLRSLCRPCHQAVTRASMNGRPEYCVHGYRIDSDIGCCA